MANCRLTPTLQEKYIFLSEWTQTGLEVQISLTGTRSNGSWPSKNFATCTKVHRNYEAMGWEWDTVDVEVT